jgi:hypothetical protein
VPGPLLGTQKPERKSADAVLSPARRSPDVSEVGSPLLITAAVGTLPHGKPVALKNRCARTFDANAHSCSPPGRRLLGQLDRPGPGRGSLAGCWTGRSSGRPQRGLSR